MNNMNMPNTTQDDVLTYLRTIPSGITFIHGKAGSGKTYLIKKLISEISGCQVLTPTNLAASLYLGARTIHSFFYGALDDLDEGYQNPDNLNSTIYEIYTEVVKHPQKQYQTENRTISVKLV